MHVESCRVPNDFEDQSEKHAYQYAPCSVSNSLERMYDEKKRKDAQVCSVTAKRREIPELGLLQAACTECTLL
jgi:hypothetical protein